MEKKTGYDAVVFDMDGVIFDSERAVMQCWKELADKYQIPDIEKAVQDDIRMQAELEAKKQKEQMPKKIGDRIQWARERSEEHNAQIKKNKTKYRGMEL